MTKAPLPALALPPVGRPKAAREQLDVKAYENGLLALARVNHPTVAWWHGYRQSQERFGSYCYVCETLIVTWSRKYPIPKAAALMIDLHKKDHRAGRLPATTAPPRKAHTS